MQISKLQLREILQRKTEKIHPRKLYCHHRNNIWIIIAAGRSILIIHILYNWYLFFSTKMNIWGWMIYTLLFETYHETMTLAHFGAFKSHKFIQNHRLLLIIIIIILYFYYMYIYIYINAFFWGENKSNTICNISILTLKNVYFFTVNNNSKI